MTIFDNLKRSSATGAIKLKRGGREVEFKKMPDRFALRLKHGRAKNSESLLAICGYLGASIKHIEGLPIAQMDVFEVDDRTKLDSAMDTLRASPDADVVSHIYRIGEGMESEVVPTGILTLQFKPEIKAEAREKKLSDGRH